MSIKVELKGSVENKAEISYPCIMVSSNGHIVLFKWKGSGTLLGYTDRWPKELEKQVIGHFTPEWNMSKFTPYTGEITIVSNPYTEMDFFNKTLTEVLASSGHFRYDHTKENKSNTPKSNNISQFTYDTDDGICLTPCLHATSIKIGSLYCIESCPHFHDMDREQSIVYCKYKGQKR